MGKSDEPNLSCLLGPEGVTDRHLGRKKHPRMKTWEEVNANWRAEQGRITITEPGVTKTPSPLLTLPAEIRNKIYGHVLYVPRAIKVPPYYKTREVCPPLLATCHQIRQEAGPIYAEVNKFHLMFGFDEGCRKAGRCFALWLQYLGENVDHVKSLSFTSHGPYRVELNMMPNPALITVTMSHIAMRYANLSTDAVDWARKLEEELRPLVPANGKLTQRKLWEFYVRLHCRRSEWSADRLRSPIGDYEPGYVRQFKWELDWM